MSKDRRTLREWREEHRRSQALYALICRECGAQGMMAAVWRPPGTKAGSGAGGEGSPLKIVSMGIARSEIRMRKRFPRRGFEIESACVECIACKFSTGRIMRSIARARNPQARMDQAHERIQSCKSARRALQQNAKRKKAP